MKKRDVSGASGWGGRGWALDQAAGRIRLEGSLRIEIVLCLKMIGDQEVDPGR